MKKFFTLFAFISTVIIGKFSYSQTTCSGGPSACSIAATGITSSVTSFQTIGGNCVMTMNVTFNLSHNNGLKWSPIYFYDGSIPAGVCGTTPSSSAGLLGFILLERIGGNNFQIATNTVNTLTPQTSYTVTTTAITGGTQINLSAVVLTKSGPCTTPQVALYVGAENSAKPSVQCYVSGFLTGYRLSVSGKIDCSGPRNYDLFIDTDYQASSTASPVSGNYEVYVDADNDGIVDAGELQITSSTSFTTSVITPTLNRYTSFDNFYGSSFSSGDPLSTANLLVVVTPTTLGLAPIVGRLTNSCAALPVSLMNFNVKKQTGKVSITWETAEESNNKGFEVQRRLNNGQYQTVAFVPAKAINGGGASYSYDDQALLPDGSIYYRLRQVDNDEQSRYSDIRMIHNNTKKLNVSVYPNPSNGAATLILPEAAGSMDITIEDYTGRTVQRWTSYNSNNLQINQLRPGIYMIRVQSKESGEQTVQRLMVQ